MVLLPLVVGKPYVVHHRNTFRLQYHLHGDFVHAVGAAQGVATGERDADGLQHALEDSVLAVGAVQHGNGRMQRGHDRILLAEQTAARIGLVQIVITIFGTHVHLLARRRQRVHVAIIADVEQLRAGVPPALLRDVDRNYLILILIKCVDGLQRRDHRNLVLHRPSSEKYSYVGLHYILLMLFFSFCLRFFLSFFLKLQN